MTALDGYALQLLDDWLAYPNNGRGGLFSNDALDGYARDVRSWLTFCVAEDIDCWATGPLAVGRWADTRRGSTARTRAKAVSVLRSFYGYAIAQGLAADNPATEAVRGRVGNTPATRVTTRECAAAIRSAADRYRGSEPERARLFVYLLLAGLRPGQICDLLIQARHTEQHRNTWDVPQKGGGTRLLAFPREITGAVDEYLPHRTHRAPATPPNTPDHSSPPATAAPWTANPPHAASCAQSSPQATPKSFPHTSPATRSPTPPKTCARSPSPTPGLRAGDRKDTRAEVGFAYRERQRFAALPVPL